MSLKNLEALESVSNVLKQNATLCEDLLSEVPGYNAELPDIPHWTTLKVMLEELQRVYKSAANISQMVLLAEKESLIDEEEAEADEITQLTYEISQDISHIVREAVESGNAKTLEITVKPGIRDESITLH